MLNTQDFVKCITGNLKQRGFGAKRIKEIVTDFETRAGAHIEDGLSGTDASTLAMQEVFDRMTEVAVQKAKRTAKMLSVQASNHSRIKQGLNVKTSAFVLDGKKSSKGVALARAAVSLIEDDPRFKGTSYSVHKETVRGQLYSYFGDTLEQLGKGFMGRQKGKAHLPNVIREVLKPGSTGDELAGNFASAWLKVQDVGVDLFNLAGGSMSKLERYIPQAQNAVRLVQAGEKAWTKAHMDALDWNRMRWPDGSHIKPEERADVLSYAYRTLTSDGASKIDTTAFTSKGRAMGNALNTHRFLHYKDADAWLKIHDQFGDGNVFEVFIRHIDDFAHRIAMVETFGPNPDAAVTNVASIVRKYASDVSAKDLADAEAVMKNKFQPMMRTISRENPMDPHSTMGNLVTGVANILTSAQLGSASFLAIPGDFMQTAAVRALNGMGMFDGLGFYMKSLATDTKFMREIATQTGFVMDEVVMSTYAQTRFTGLATQGPAITRHISEATMRASLMSGHTRSARWTVQAEFMGLMNRSRKMKFEDLPFRHVMERYGITSEAWDAMRQNVKEWNPRQDVKFMRPLDILDSDVSNKQDLYRRFQGMIFDEARKMVPEATIEGSVALKDTTRPDTLVGALLYSFSMYKNFPVSFAMIYGRIGLASPSVKGRLAFYAGLGAGMTAVGALGTQMREVSKGRDPLPMDTPGFLGKAFLSGGALSIYGDFIFQGINEFGRGPQDMVAGPLVGVLGDTTQLVLGDVFQWANSVGGLSDGDFKTKTPARAVEFARRYTPGTTVWWARAALQRQVFDRLQEIADPKAYRKKRRRKSRRRQKDYGQGSWWSPGSRTPDRAPEFGGR